MTLKKICCFNTEMGTFADFAVFVFADFWGAANAGL